MRIIFHLITFITIFFITTPSADISAKPAQIEVNNDIYIASKAENRKKKMYFGILNKSNHKVERFHVQMLASLYTEVNAISTTPHGAPLPPDLVCHNPLPAKPSTERPVHQQ